MDEEELDQESLNSYNEGVQLGTSVAVMLIDIAEKYAQELTDDKGFWDMLADMFDEKADQ